MGGRAVWILAGAVAAVAGLSLVLGAQLATFTLVLLLLLTAAARWVLRRERPEGLAVRSWGVDALVSVSFAIAIALLALTPGV
jgi:hypothetical protein